MFNFYKHGIVVLQFFGLLFFSKSCYAQLRLCNDTADAIGVALGYQNAASWLSKGWWQVPPMSCNTIIKAKLSSRYYYIHAEDGKNENRWEGPIFLCVTDGKFTIKGINNCYVRGYQKAGFREIDTKNNTSWTVHLGAKDEQP